MFHCTAAASDNYLVGPFGKSVFNTFLGNDWFNLNYTNGRPKFNSDPVLKHQPSSTLLRAAFAFGAEPIFGVS